MNYLRKIGSILHHVGSEYVNDGCSSTAAALSYVTLLAIVPLMLVSLSIASKVPAFTNIFDNLQNFILHNFVASVADSISVHLHLFLDQINRLSWMNIIALVVSSLFLLFDMVYAFNCIWDVKMEWHRHFTLHFFIRFGILLITPFLLLALVLVISYVSSLSLFSGPHFKALFSHPVLKLLPYFFGFVTFTYFNWVLPTTRVKFRFAAIAGFVTMLLFELVKYLFALYVTEFPTYKIIYGALAAIPIFFVWVYLSWTVILLGAILCKELQSRALPV